ncbi:MAG: tautomerase family protein [Methanobacteriales archaeon HGW-Methanobacteriales-1]|jgi:phenylpyruvate tautomerase PptA (4-oxalocrotonate tautomerase family)|nr:MAG: tautomerase family protein [Methanobacteriales archaeon HGW-Methanobacteriales-1]
MPLVKIEILKGYSEEYKKAILDAVHDALVESIKIPDDDRFQRLYELEKENFEFPPNKSEHVTLIEITMFPGRSFDAKKALYQKIVDKLAKNPGIDGEDILIILYEPPMDNWALKGGKPASEVDIGFKIDV